ncbi:MAG: crotonase/enoyl-CoA hydratase family protein [Dehalococcoidia bacterium]|nr:crotonase/enoyl-CoA hydratase family protein [Dehalococcoidia bacterium]
MDGDGRGSRFRGENRLENDVADAPVVLYEERDGLAIITLNRPEKMNTLNNDVIQGIADGIDRATASAAVAAVILRGAGRTFTAGYDLNPGDGRWPAPRRYDAASPPQRPGAWDPVRDLSFMGHNMQRFMKLWECPKPVIAQMHGYALGGGTDLLLCADLIFMAEDAIIGYPPSRVYGTPTTMMWVYRLGLEHAKQFLLSGDQVDAATALRIGLVSKVFPLERLQEETEAYARRFAAIPGNQLALNKLLINQAFENMGLRTTQLFGTLFDGITRHTEEALRWQESFREIGFRQTISRRDAPFGDYGERPR